jgi:hypothetical protein
MKVTFCPFFLRYPEEQSLKCSHIFPACPSEKNSIKMKSALGEIHRDVYLYI